MGSLQEVSGEFRVLDSEPYQYQKTMSDAAGLDPRAHDDKPGKMIACVRDFLSAGLDPKPIGPTAISALYDNFVSALPAIAAEADLTLADIEPLTARESEIVSVLVDFVPPVTGIHLAALTPPCHEVEVIHEQHASYWVEEALQHVDAVVTGEAEECR
jgi:hypothetical protein